MHSRDDPLTIQLLLHAIQVGLETHFNCESWRQYMMIGNEIALTLVSVVLIGCGQILFKLAARDAAFAGFTWHTVALWSTPAMLAALAVSTIATGLWVWVLRSASLSVVYPLYALTFVLVPMLDWLLFDSIMTTRHWAGAAIIISGVWLMAGAGA